MNWSAVSSIHQKVMQLPLAAVTRQFDSGTLQVENAATLWKDTKNMSTVLRSLREAINLPLPAETVQFDYGTLTRGNVFAHDMVTATVSFMSSIPPTTASLPLAATTGQYVYGTQRLGFAVKLSLAIPVLSRRLCSRRTEIWLHPSVTT